MGKFDAGLTSHAIKDCTQGIDWGGAKVVFMERNTKRRKVKESIETMKEDVKGERKTLNRCECLPESYRPVVKKVIEKERMEKERRKNNVARRVVVGTQGGV